MKNPSETSPSQLLSNVLSNVLSNDTNSPSANRAVVETKVLNSEAQEKRIRSSLAFGIDPENADPVELDSTEILAIRSVDQIQPSVLIESSQASKSLANQTVAIVEDDDSVRKSLSLNLELEGFKVITARDGEEGVALVREKSPDIIILDVMMPKKDGLEACREIRNLGISTPLILLTARSAEVDKVLGLELGADDYLAKPFGMRELIARVRALLRRTQTTSEVDRVHFDDVAIDFKAYKAERNRQPLELSAREYRLLRYLVAKKGAVVTRDELLDEVWGYNSYPSTRTVDNHIARLRQKIERNVEEPKHILTVHGVGYKFVA